MPKGRKKGKAKQNLSQTPKSDAMPGAAAVATVALNYGPLAIDAVQTLVSVWKSKFGKKDADNVASTAEKEPLLTPANVNASRESDEFVQKEDMAEKDREKLREELNAIETLKEQLQQSVTEARRKEEEIREILQHIQKQNEKAEKDREHLQKEVDDIKALKEQLRWCGLGVCALCVLMSVFTSLIFLK